MNTDGVKLGRKVLAPDDQFLIVACGAFWRLCPLRKRIELCCVDGIWDVLSDEEATLFVGTYLDGQDPKNAANARNAAEALVNLAYEKRSMDNMTAIVVIF